ncbi:lebercilin-like protein [Protopterus annectens]|uniref:lebercilin-like protein n=1 Tax=Protopterus annectens TaxID=7888 RepID=UPI001CFAAAA5|nr:lebercilin-like protein [Protopterus annectens]
MFSSDQQFVPSRILSARIKRINELQNEISDQTRQLEATFSENKALKKLQQRHMKALINFEAKEGSLSQLFVRHNTEVKTLRELLRNSKMQGQSMSRKLQETNVELLKTKNVLHKLQKLSEDKNLAERNEIIQQLSVVADKLDNKEKKIQVGNILQQKGH